MHHRLIMFYGVSPGAGKTTLSDWLKSELTTRSIPSWWIEEHDILTIDLFAEVVNAFTQGADGYVTPILTAATKLVDQQKDRSEIILMDSLFPGFTWLFAAGVLESEIAAFSQQLAELLKPLSPLVIWLDGDVRTLLERAVAQRGVDWLRDLAETVNTYNYAPVRPVVGTDELVAFFESVRILQTNLFTSWPHELLTLHVTDSSFEACINAIRMLAAQ